MKYYGSLKTQIAGSFDLMRHRVTEILLIATPYDGFVLEEDGLLSEQIYDQFVDLNIPFVPRIHRVLSLPEALGELRKRRIDLIITMNRVNFASPFEFERLLKEEFPDVPIVLLSYERFTPEMIAEIRANEYIDRAFYWSGDNKILMAIIKYVEDRKNFKEDCKQGVQAVLIVEDSPVYYSRFLPVIYTEILTQTRYLVSHAINSSHGLMRVRLRPKILLAETSEEAMSIIGKYQNNLLGVICDAQIPVGGKISLAAGVELAKNVRGINPIMPFLFQAEEQEDREKANELGLACLEKSSPNLLQELETYIYENYGFGPFIFKYPDGRIIARAADITIFERIIRYLPDESLRYHMASNHFSLWFRARTEFTLAQKLTSSVCENFSRADQIRSYVLENLAQYFQKCRAGEIMDFRGLSQIDVGNAFVKLGKGSLGGKARGIAFFNSLLAENKLADKFNEIKIQTPSSFVICSDVFEEFMQGNNLYEFVAEARTDEEIAARFSGAELPESIAENLLTLAENITYPLAVRSSSILEDSRQLPFAGIYKTYILPNSHNDASKRLKHLLDAVKLVYASVFYASPTRYAQNAGIKIKEEKMAVLIQQLVGEQYGNYFYPNISGVAQSYNFYPSALAEAEDGIVNLALGFGKTIVDGEQVYRLSPAYPASNPHFSSPGDYFKKSQVSFYALNLKASENIKLSVNDDITYEKCYLSQAAQDGSLEYVTSTYSAEDNCIYDNPFKAGPKIVTFAPILKYETLPLTAVIKELLALGKHAFGGDVEIEFAVNIPKDKSRPKEFYLLQIRPMGTGNSEVQVEIDENRPAVCVSNHTIGNGIFENIRDIIFVDPQEFKLNNTLRIAAEIGEMNKILYEEGRKCILIGIGRLGTSDNWLGIPLTWSQMSQAQIVVEADTAELQPEPSLGSHFFHNLTSMNMLYFHIGYKGKTDETVEWEWLRAQPAFKQVGCVRLFRRDEPFLVKVDGRNMKGVVYR